MNKRFVQNRREIKYLVDLAQAEAFRERLNDVLIPDSHDGGQGYFNYSVYFDSPALTFYKEKIEGLATRMKPRLRTYRQLIDGPPDAIFLEFKHRERDFISKEREALSADRAGRLLQGDTVLDTAVSADSPVIDKFSALARKMDLRTCAGVLYHRTAFSCAVQPGLRITFDRRLLCTEVCTLSPPIDAFAPIEPATRAVIELKYDSTVPDWILNTAAAMEMRQLSFSKYANAIERTHSRHRRSTP